MKPHPGPSLLGSPPRCGRREQVEREHLPPVTFPGPWGQPGLRAAGEDLDPVPAGAWNPQGVTRGAWPVGHFQDSFGKQVADAEGPSEQGRSATTCGRQTFREAPLGCERRGRPSGWETPDVCYTSYSKTESPSQPQGGTCLKMSAPWLREAEFLLKVTQ